MAADPTTLPVNGNYAPPAYDMSEQNYDQHAADRTASNTAEYATSSVAAGTDTASGGGNSDIPKDEVAWFFVEKYYTTLSKSPEKLFLFYNKSSQFVSGTETEKAPVCVGQTAINERIKELDIQDCKVRVTNVDSQASRSNIVIQVIGEISNKSAPQQKFTQTFVLAEQANGYFVLNDIFRYLLDDEEEFTAGEEELAQAQVEAASGYQEPAAAVPDEAPQTLTSSDNPQEQARDVALIDQSLEKAINDEAVAVEPPSTTINGGVDTSAAADEAKEEDTPVPVAATVDDTPLLAAEATAPAEAVNELQPEKPKDPMPSPAETPAQPPVAQATAAPAAATKPAAPKTWANLVAGNRANAVVAPALPAAQPAASSTSAKATPPLQTQAVATPTAPASSTTELQELDQADTPQSSGSEWQTAGHEHSRKQSRTQGAQTPAENSRAYIKNVNDNVDVAALQAALAKISEVSYVDINRQKNCAFVDFATPAGYRAALAANPHEVSGERLYVEERRVRPQGTYPGGYNGRNGGVVRGNNSRPGSQGRGGFQKDSTRGAYTGRGRGNVGARGRGGVSQTA